tara:strand:- start:16 stop:360 length:345 start_codon:yes stop_codon:yes gene_type:complete
MEINSRANVGEKVLSKVRERELAKRQKTNKSPMEEKEKKVDKKVVEPKEKEKKVDKKVDKKVVEPKEKKVEPKDKDKSLSLNNKISEVSKISLKNKKEIDGLSKKLDKVLSKLK